MSTTILILDAAASACDVLLARTYNSFLSVRKRSIGARRLPLLCSFFPPLRAHAMQDSTGANGPSEGSTERCLTEQAARLTDLARELHDAAAALASRAAADEQSLRTRALALDSDLRRLQSSVNSDLKNGSIDPTVAEKVEEELDRARYALSEGDAAFLLPTKAQGKFLKMFLGPVNVRATRKEIQLKVKEEYNNYRDRTAILFLLFPSILLLLRSWIWDGCFPTLPVQLYQAWLLFLYTSLALRENVLRANGSDIRPWWIYHHYCAMLMALISLTWEIKGEPDCGFKQRGVQLFLAWAIMQGVAMLLQNRYQRQRLYTRIALGKAKRMDVVWGETAGVRGQLLLLCPILFTLQGFEAYVGVLLLRIALFGATSEWQVIVCGILLIVMAVGNFVNTVQTLMEKSRVKARVKRIKTKQDMDH
ncbi:transmembrane protein 120 [Canna indica]|uniref:Transmembrane protein 120 n=1 Tax=Canna indica TaxID=4628 RepID=A0AAQ3KG11_9LILI|nr:transmembrane protein 120 [Canna indica]